MIKSRYRKKIRIPVIGDEKTHFFTKGKLRISSGYSRIVIENKPIVEFSERNIALNNLIIPHYLKWMEFDEQSDWVCYRSKDYCRVKVKFSKSKRLFFCSLCDLSATSDNIFIEEPISA